MAEYLLAVHGSVEDAEKEFGGYASKEDMQEAFEAVGALNERLEKDGCWVFAGGLQPAATATVVDNTGDAPITTDGPYLETKEHIGGFWVLDLPDLDSALAIAREASKACKGKVEVRPFQGGE